jgi:hypothetical protein
MTPLQLASGLTVSVVAGTNLTRVQPELNLLRATAQREQLLLHLRCYTPVCPVPSDARQYTVEQVGCLASDEHFGQSDLIVYHFPDCGRLIESIHFAPRRARVVVVFTDRCVRLAHRPVGTGRPPASGRRSGHHRRATA